MLENELVLAGLVHRDYSREFQRVGSTVSIRKPATFTSGTVSSTVNMATATESSVDVVLNTHLDITINITAQELSLSIVDFSEQILRPMMQAHAQAVDTQIAGLYSDVAAHYGVSSTPAVSDIAGVRAVQNVMKVPMRDRRLVLHPMTEADYIHLNAFLNAEKVGDTQALKEAHLGRRLGYDIYMDQNMATHTTGGFAASTATLLVKTAGTAAATALTVYGGVASGTINAGDVFKVTGYDQWHSVSAAATANASGTIALTISPAIGSAYAGGSTVTFQQTHRANLAFHKNAFALVTAPLEPPLGGARGEVLTYKGLSARVVYDYTMMTKNNLISVDMLLGTKTLDKDLAARLCDAR